ncbi:MAG TPA: DUF3313 family protein [Steroidobacteraceae bacterium]|nr:DUF3313 family protein [Steroidobacteraceae bacterium]
MYCRFSITAATGARTSEARVERRTLPAGGATMFIRTLIVSMAFLCSVAGAQVIADMTEDGLVRVPSSRKAGVFRLPDATFAQYRRVMLAPASVAIRKDPDKYSFSRLDTGLKPSERQRIVNDMSLAFHEELVAELVERGGFALAEAPAPDVLLIVPMITEVDLSIAGSMTLIVELLDAASGVTVGRIVDYEQGSKVQLMTYDAIARIAYANAARYTRSAINIAKTERDETASDPR